MSQQTPIGNRSSLRGFISNALSFRGTKNILSWLTAGTLAYFWYYVPEQRRQQEQEQAREMARRLAIERGYQNTDVDRRKPVADPQDTGLLRGTKASERNS